MSKKRYTKEWVENHTKQADISFEYAPTDWRSGLLVGNGDIGAIEYAPGGREWIINKLDVFDGRKYDCDITPHDEMMKLIKEKGEKYTYFIDELEKRRDNMSAFRSVTPVILKLMVGSGELGWGAPAFPKISDRLSMYDGMITSVSDAHFTHSAVQTVAPRAEEIIAISISGCTIADWDSKLEIYRPYNDDLENPVFSKFEDGGIAFTQKLFDGIGSYAVAVLPVLKKPDISRVTYALPHDFNYSDRRSYMSDVDFRKLTASRMCGGDMDIFVSVTSSYRYNDPLKKAIDNVRRAAKVGFDGLREENALWWHSFWERSVADFGENSDLNKHWISALYSLAVSYGRAPMPALAGMFYGPLGPTSPGVTTHTYNTDQNTQIPVFPSPIINHAEFIEVFADTLIKNADVMRRHTKELFGKTGGEGIYIPLSGNQNGEELNPGSYRYTMCGSAYSGLILARAYEYTRDERLMREKYAPLLAEFIRFYTNNLMHLSSDGIYHLDPTVPPEIFMFTKDDLSTLSMLKSCMRVLLEWYKKEGISTDESKLWSEILENYPKLATRSDGSYIGGPDIPQDYFSFGTHQLYPFFPAEEYQDEKGCYHAERTIDYINTDAIERCYSGEHDWHFIHGWSWFLYHGTLMHLGQDKNVFDTLRDFIRYFAKSNGLFIHNSLINIPSSESENNHKSFKPKDKLTADMTTTMPWYGTRCTTPNAFSKDMTAPVIEGGAIFLQLASEAMLMSYDGIIRLFQYVPDDFTGGFADFYAKGGIRVCAYCEKGKITELSLSADEHKEMRVLLTKGMTAPDGAELVSHKDGAVMIIRAKELRLTF